MDSSLHESVCVLSQLQTYMQYVALYAFASLQKIGELSNEYRTKPMDNLVSPAVYQMKDLTDIIYSCSSGSESTITPNPRRIYRWKCWNRSDPALCFQTNSIFHVTTIIFDGYWIYRYQFGPWLFGATHDDFVFTFVFTVLWLCCDFWVVKNVTGMDRLFLQLRSIQVGGWLEWLGFILKMKLKVSSIVLQMKINGISNILRSKKNICGNLFGFVDFTFIYLSWIRLVYLCGLFIGYLVELVISFRCNGIGLWLPLLGWFSAELIFLWVYKNTTFVYFLFRDIGNVLNTLNQITCNNGSQETLWSRIYL